MNFMIILKGEFLDFLVRFSVVVVPNSKPTVGKRAAEEGENQRLRKLILSQK